MSDVLGIKKDLKMRGHHDCEKCKYMYVPKSKERIISMEKNYSREIHDGNLYCRAGGAYKPLISKRKTYIGVTPSWCPRLVYGSESEIDYTDTEHYKRNKKGTLCWYCENFAGKCEWSREFKEVKGWVADKKILRVRNDDSGCIDTVSYVVKKCPKFKEG